MCQANVRIKKTHFISHLEPPMGGDFILCFNICNIQCR